MAYMTGTYSAKVDEKGRLFVPARLREDLGSVFYVTIGTHEGRKCLTVYTKESWERLNERFQALPLSQQFSRLGKIFQNAVECVPDKQFRFLLTPKLFRYAGITKDVVITGISGVAQIWDAAAYEQYELETDDSEDLLDAMEAIRI